jgi:hypothetical protein
MGEGKKKRMKEGGEGMHTGWIWTEAAEQNQIANMSLVRSEMIGTTTDVTGGIRKIISEREREKQSIG